MHKISIPVSAARETKYVDVPLTDFFPGSVLPTYSGVYIVQVEYANHEMFAYFGLDSKHPSRERGWFDPGWSHDLAVNNYKARRRALRDFRWKGIDVKTGKPATPGVYLQMNKELPQVAMFPYSYFVRGKWYISDDTVKDAVKQYKSGNVSVIQESRRYVEML